MAIISIYGIGIAVYSITQNGFGVDSSENERPNVLVLLIDDMDVNGMETLFDQGWMPTLDSMRNNGTTFVNAYATTPLCCPSRASLLTGQYTHNHQVYANIGDYGGADKLHEEDSVSVKLKQAGYTTAFVGKYLNSYGAYTEREHIPLGWDHWIATIPPTGYKMYDFMTNINGRVVKVQHEYQIDYLSAQASLFIHKANNENDSKPFLLYLSTLTPHSEIKETSCVAQGQVIDLIRAETRYEGTARELKIDQSKPSFNEIDTLDKAMPFRAKPSMTAEDVACVERLWQDRLESMRSVDDLLSDVMITLEATGELDNTVIFFISDNGFMLGEHRYIGKFWYYEESVRIPFYMYGANTTGRIDDSLVLNIDIVPTILDIAGVDRSDLDGRSLLRPIERDDFLIEAYFENRNDTAYAGVHTGDMVYVERYDHFPEFYDMKVDPYQTQNRINSPEYQEAITSMKQRLEELRNCKGVECA